MRVVAAMSGGVDSSVAAFELKRTGNDVIGVTIKTWPKEECGAEGEKLCCSLEAIQYARSVAEDLDIPYYVIDLSKEFTKEVRDYFVEEYARGRTPNPCIYCNSRIKFGYLLQKAREMGAEKVATGHYALITRENERYYLVEAKDEWYDQSYFLYDIDRSVLPFIEFPIGSLSKQEVREIAINQDFMPAWRRSSQDICFASPGGGYREYLEELGLEVFSPGDILDPSGKVIGKHRGIAAYTVGQRRGLGLAMKEPVYVLKIDPDNNTITVGEKHEAMNTKIRATNVNWISIEGLAEPKEFMTRIRYNSEKVPALASTINTDDVLVEFNEPQFAPAPGQAVVFYDNGKVAGGGWIAEVIE